MRLLVTVVIVCFVVSCSGAEPLDIVSNGKSTIVLAHDYDGHGWYRFTVDIPGKLKDKPISLFCGGAINEAWVNGEYVGHRGHVIWWMGKNEIDMDGSEYVRTGKNTVAIRIWNDLEIDGMFNRSFLWSQKEVEMAAVVTDEN